MGRIWKLVGGLAGVAGLHLAVLLGWAPLTAEQEAQAMLVIGLVGTAVVVVWSRGKVTPVADPHSADGVPLVPRRVLEVAPGVAVVFDAPHDLAAVAAGAGDAPACVGGGASFEGFDGVDGDGGGVVGSVAGVECGGDFFGGGLHHGLIVARSATRCNAGAGWLDIC